MQQEGHVRSLQLLAGGDERGARLQAMDSQRDAELLGVTDSHQRDLINAKFDAMQQAEERQYTYRSRQVATTLTAQQSALRSALRREPGEAGEAAVMAGEGINNFRELIRAGQLDNATSSFQTSILGLQLLKQTYFDNFRGAQVDPRLIATQGARQSEDLGTVIMAIEKQTEELKSAYRDAMLEAFAGG
jgi:hypothetical protein